MYNGIGLQGPRGSGTNGYVRKNLSSVKPKDRDNSKKLSDTGVSSLRKLNNDIVEHDRKRKLEIKCLELQQMLEDQGYADDEIEKRVSSYRSSLNEECMTSITVKDKRKRTQKREIPGIAEERTRKNDTLYAGSFVGGSNFDPNRRVKETNVEPTKSPLVSSEEEEGEIAEKSSRKSKKRSRKSSSPRIGDSKKRKKKKKKKKHKRKSKSESHRKHKSRHSHHSSKHDRRTKTPESHNEFHSDHRSRDQCSQSPTRRRSQTPRSSNHRAENKLRQLSKTTERHRSSTANEKTETKRSNSKGKRRSRTPEKSSSEKRAHHAEDGKRKRSASPAENLRDSRPSKRYRRYSKTPELDHQYIEATSKESKRGSHCELPDEKSSKRGPYCPEDEPMSAPSSSSSQKFRAATSSKTFRKRYSSSPEAAYEDRSRWTATKCAKEGEKPDRLNEKGVVLRYSDSEVETDESEESAPKTMSITLKDNQNDHIADAIQLRGKHQYPWKVAKPLSSPCSKSSSDSPMKFSSQREPEVSKAVPKKASRPERETEPVKETTHADSVEGMPNVDRAPSEREKTSKSKLATEMPHRIKFEVTGASLRKIAPRMGEKVVHLLPKNDTVIHTAVHPPSDRVLGRVELAAESGEATRSASDMVDEAVKTTVTALAANREKTLESLKKLLSHALPTDKESDTGSNSKSPPRERRSVSTRSSSRSSDSSHSSRSRDLSTSFKGSSSESSNSSRASSLSRRKRRRGSCKSKRESRRSRRRSSSKSSGTSRSRSSRSRSSSGDEEQKKTRRTTDRSSSSSSSGRSRSRSTSIPRRKGSPSFLERRRITSARRRPVPYPRSAVLYGQSPPRSTSYQSSSSSSSCSGSTPSSGHDSTWESSYSLV